MTASWSVFVKDLSQSPAIGVTFKLESASIQIRLYSLGQIQQKNNRTRLQFKKCRCFDPQPHLGSGFGPAQSIVSDVDFLCVQHARLALNNGTGFDRCGAGTRIANVDLLIVEQARLALDHRADSNI